MLAIRMQRTGRSGHAHFRVVVQDSRWSPKSGKFVAMLGSYDPHSKTSTLDKEKAQAFLNNGAQPSDRVVNLLKAEGVKLPKWVTKSTKKQGKIRNPEKLRKNRPADAETPAPTAEAAEEAAGDVVEAETKATQEEPAAAETPTNEPTAEAEQELPEPKE